MRGISQNLAFQGSRDGEPNGAKTTREAPAAGSVANWAEASRVATHCLGLRQIKSWAIDLGVSQRTVQRWAAGEVPIPRSRLADIIALAKGYFLHLGEIEAAVDRLILMRLGRPA